jgi:hypothetical protein
MELRSVECQLISSPASDYDWRQWVWIIRELPVGRSVEWSHPRIGQRLACALIILEENHRTFLLPAGFFELSADEQYSLLRVFAVSAVLDDEELSAKLETCESGDFPRRVR